MHVASHTHATHANVRVLLDEHNDPWFVAKDVCNILGTDTRDVGKILDDDEKGVDSIHTLGGNQQMTTVSEAGLYKLIMRSRKENAKPFQRWVTHEVLPTIRKHGAYMSEQTIEQALASPDFLIKLATQLKNEQEARKQATLLSDAKSPFFHTSDEK